MYSVRIRVDKIIILLIYFFKTNVSYVEILLILRI